MKTNLDRIRQLIQMCRGENVVEKYNSKRTAAAEFNKMFGMVNSNLFWHHVWQGSLGSEKSASFFGCTVDEIAPVLKEFQDAIGSGVFDVRTTSMTVSNSKYFTDQNKNLSGTNGFVEVDTTPRHSFFFFINKNGKPVESGEYRAEFEQTTQTGRQKALDYANELLRKYNEQKGLYFHDTYTVYDARTMTKRDFDSYVHRLEAAIENNIPVPPCSEKQAFWVAKKMNCPQQAAERLNKEQASQLLGVLFDKDGHYAYHKVERDGILNHYSKILGLGVNEGMINRIVDNVLNEILHR